MNEKQHFAEVAQRYCEWVEADQHDLAGGRTLLLELLLRIAPLKVHFSSEEPKADYPQIGHEGWKSNFKRLSDLPLQSYLMASSPCDLKDRELLVSNLPDDLADIYGDLWKGLQAWKVGDEPGAVAIWYSMYVFHWGNHASAALYAVDEYLREQVEL